jgi:zinc and cadmium transporter
MLALQLASLAITHTPAWTEPLLAVLAVQAIAAVGVLSLHRLDALLRRSLPYLIATAVGVLLATGVAHLLPEAVEALGARSAVWLILLLTMLALYAFERIFQLLSGVSAEPAAEAPPAEPAHAHHDHHHASRPATLLLGCVTHSLVDGVSVAAAFSVSRSVGWVTALAVGLHEIPHRLGDFALLVHMGVHRTRAAALAVAAGASSLLGWAIVALLGAKGSGPVAWLLPVSAGSFLYIALVDLLPELRSEKRPSAVLGQLAALALGVILALALSQLPGA